jgi:putative DNA primase/helicase
MSDGIVRILEQQRKASGQGEQVDAHSTNRSVIRLGAELHKTADEAETALIEAGAPLYSRFDSIVRPAVEEVDAAHGRKTKAARLITVTVDMLVDYLSEAAAWERFIRREKTWVAASPPEQIARILLSRIGRWQLPPIAGVITTPTLRPDGTILSEPGYDPVTRLLLVDPPPMPDIPKRPSRDDALNALALLDDLLNEFPFVDEASRSVALSGLLTPVLRGALLVAPMHVFRAPAPGTGKSYLVDIACAILSGQLAPVISAGYDEAEMEKRLGAKLIAGHPLISVDNVNGQIGGDALCQAIERPIVDVRVLGLSKTVRIENRASIFANGNNIVLVGDMVRRVIMGSLDANMERPELRAFSGDPIATILADRGRYIAAILTIAKAYITAGYPSPCPPLASFEDWSRLVRSPLTWLGRADPVDTIEAARAEDPELANLRSVVAAWHEVVGLNKPRSTGELKSIASSLEDQNGNLQRALITVASTKKEIDQRKLGHWLGRRRNRVIDGLKIVSHEDAHSKQLKWSLTRVSQ